MIQCSTLINVPVAETHSTNAHVIHTAWKTTKMNKPHIDARTGIRLTTCSKYCIHKRSKYISNLPPKENKEDSIPWTCIKCNKIQNEDGRCANISNSLCPKCFYELIKNDLEWMTKP